jgi:hypothetical protein
MCFAIELFFISSMGVFLMMEFYNFMKDDSDSIMTRLDTIFMTINMSIGHGNYR